MQGSSTFNCNQYIASGLSRWVRFPHTQFQRCVTGLTACFGLVLLGSGFFQTGGGGVLRAVEFSFSWAHKNKHTVVSSMPFTNYSFRCASSCFLQHLKMLQAVCWSPAHLLLQDQLRHAFNHLLQRHAAQGSPAGKTELLNTFLQIWPENTHFPMMTQGICASFWRAADVVMHLVSPGNMVASCSVAWSNTRLPGRSRLLSGGLCCSRAEVSPASGADGWTNRMDLCVYIQELGACLRSLKCPEWALTGGAADRLLVAKTGSSMLPLPLWLISWYRVCEQREK